MKVSVNKLQGILNHIQTATIADKERSELRYPIPGEVNLYSAPTKTEHLTFRYDKRNEYWYIEI
jgi:hypothetical protein